MAHPENGIETLREYLPVGLAARLPAVAEGLGKVLLTGVTPEQASVAAVNRARRDLRGILSDEAFGRAAGALQNTDRDGVYDLIAQRRFDGALARVGDIGTVPKQIDEEMLDRALRRQPMEFTFIVVIPPETEIDPDTGKPVTTPGFEDEREGTLAGYSGPDLTDAERTALVEFGKLLFTTPERALRLPLLRAECDFGAGRVAVAMEEYFDLLRGGKIGPASRKYVAIRAAFARLALGDAAFRRTRTLDAAAREAATHEYDEAVALIAENDVAPDNPVRIQIEQYAARQKGKLAAGLNLLGLNDAHVPVQRFNHLQPDVEASLETLEKSRDALQGFLEGAQDKIGQKMDLEAQQAEEALTNQIAADQVALAGLGVDKAQEQIDLIDGQQDFLAPQAAISTAKSIVESVAEAKPGLGVITGVLGIAEATVTFLAQKEELEHQRRIAEIDKVMATGAETIAGLEKLISDNRVAYLQERLEFLEGGRINADLLLTLAGLAERRAERQLELTIFTAYLYERALAFFLGKPGIAHIQFDYLSRPGGIFDAPGALREDVDKVTAELNDQNLDKADFFEEIVSLRERYPLQFSQFQQTGEMTFDYSLYQLSKSRPATHQCRLREVGVELRPPPTGAFSGNLVHTGRFLIRDRAATLDPSTVRLEPTEEQLEQALHEQREQGSAAAAVGGVLCYNLGRDSKELGPNTQFVSQPPDQFTLDLLEGYGPTGMWKLSIADHGSLGIEDVILHFAVVSRESDTAVGGLEDKVKQLIREYETELAEGDRLDRITAFSLLQEFFDDFQALRTGPATIDLEERHFPEGLANLQFKAVIAQALDPDGQGVPGIGVEIARPEHGFTRSRVTGDGGFSEDLSVELETVDRDDRFPLLGPWQVRLTDPAQFTQLGDLTLLFLYAFEEL